MVEARVEKSFAARASVMTVETDRGVLRTTAEHPVGLPGGIFLEAGKLRPGQKVLIRGDGALPVGIRGGGPIMSSGLPETPASGRRLRNRDVMGSRRRKKRGGLQPQRWLSAHLSGGQLPGPQQGGRGVTIRALSRSGSGGSGSAGDDGFAILFFFLFTTFFIIFVVAAVKGKMLKSENLDYLYPAATVAKKAVKTEKLLSLPQQTGSVALPAGIAQAGRIDVPQTPGVLGKARLWPHGAASDAGPVPSAYRAASGAGPES